MPVPWYFNIDARKWRCTTQTTIVRQFHQRCLPGFKPTRLVLLPASISHDLGVGRVYVKEESDRLGLPSFKILGAAWAIFRLLCDRYGLDVTVSTFDLITFHAQKESDRLGNKLEVIAATDGNHGRAVAKIAGLLGLPSRIFVPSHVSEASQIKIRNEGATVVVVEGDYDASISAAFRECAEREGAILIQDCAFDGYDIIPSWIVDGYTTLFSETDEQLLVHQACPVDLIILPAGVGSFAHSAVRHYRKADCVSSPALLVVEPDAAPCINTSLVAGKLLSVPTSQTIMAGLNCGTPSTLAWPDLLAGVDASTAVTDEETLQAMSNLHNMGVDSGPCGAATLAAAREVLGGDVNVEKRKQLGLDETSTVVLISTEGVETHRFETGLDSSNEGESIHISDPVALTQALGRIASANPELSLDSEHGTGEASIAAYISSWLKHRGFEVHRLERRKGRPSIVGVSKGIGGEGARSLMFNGHIDTVTLSSYDGDPLSGKIVDGRLYGRGAFDMKGGVGALLVAAANAKEAQLRGDIIVACVADEEYASAGTAEVLEAGWRADGAIVPEPTELQILLAHKGFVWAEVDVIGVAAHGSRPDLGVDAITKAGHFLVEIDHYAERLASGPTSPGGLGRGSVHASLIKGGEEPSSYPAKCTIVIERRIVDGETFDTVQAELETILQHLHETVPSFKSDLRMGMYRQPFKISEDHPLVRTTVRCASEVLGHDVKRGIGLYWTDCALLDSAGIPALLFGVDGAGAHAATEYADVESIRRASQVLTAVAMDYCK
ncbi:hypothetical protein BS47DRAFT_1340818 [Hydnum rufescens UP504]|uniref:Succinyl-diaminopimelate desuccinylase n=1 Tax=Hydnum rufescens UP504 TaxID=1448309 RepID=A0A9P6B2K5_9AGAM|nr:hypothetical protein BS47DRAFT_1340818 [Hydnum rufescens UP504]